MGGFDVLEGAWDVATAEMEGRTYAVVASTVDDGLEIIDMTDPWAPVPAAALIDDEGRYTSWTEPKTSWRLGLMA